MYPNTKSISFYDYGIEDILATRKHSTLRYGEPELSVGSRVALTRQDGTKVGYITILAKDSVMFDALTETDAASENWISLADLKQRLLFSYPKLKSSSVLTRYRFCLSENSTGRCARRIVGHHLESDIQFSGISVLTSSEQKRRRLRHILGRVLDRTPVISDIMLPSESEPIELTSPEERAIQKSKWNNLHLSAVTVATDEMAAICVDNEVYRIADLRRLAERITRLKLEVSATVVIRTGIAMSFQCHTNYAVALRTFFVRVPKDDRRLQRRSLNEYLYLDSSFQQPVKALDEFAPELIGPIESAVKTVVRGEL